MPNALRVLIDFAHAMKRHMMNLPLVISDLECFGALRRKSHVAKWNGDHAVLRPIVVTQRKTSLGKFAIPTDAVEQFVNRNHANWLGPLETIKAGRVCDRNGDADNAIRGDRLICHDCPNGRLDQIRGGV